MTTYSNRFNLRCVCLALILITTVFASAAAQTQDDDKTLSPYFVVKGVPNVDQLPLKDTRVEIAVSAVIADVKVVQHQHLPPPSQPHLHFLFFPADGAAHAYSEVGGKAAIRGWSPGILIFLNEEDAIKSTSTQTEK